MTRTIRRSLLLTTGILAALLLFACTGPPPAPIFFDAAAWPEDIEHIALVELSFDRRYRPPTNVDLAAELRLALRRELARKGYRLLIADDGAQIYRGETSAAELAARAPAAADAALALHIDFLFLSATWAERNPPPEVEIAGEARLVAKRTARELWRDRGNGLAGGAAAMPVVYPTSVRHEALADLMSKFFASLPDRAVSRKP